MEVRSALTGRGDSFWISVPGFRFAPSGAIFNPSLREELRQLTGRRETRNRFCQQNAFTRFPDWPRSPGRFAGGGGIYSAFGPDVKPGSWKSQTAAADGTNEGERA
jgi:hypothetical protein